MQTKYIVIITVAIFAIIVAGILLLYNNNTAVTFEGIAECAKLKTGDCQSSEVKEICTDRCYTIENLDKVASFSDGTKVKVTGRTREEIFRCSTPPCALVDGTKLYYIFIDKIEKLP